MNFWNYELVLVIRLDEFKQNVHLTIIAQINTIINCLNLSAPRPFQAMEIAVLSTKKSSRSNAQRVPFFRRPRRTWTRWTGHRDRSKWGLKFGIQMGFCKVQGVFVTVFFFWHFWHFVKSRGQPWWKDSGFLFFEFGNLFTNSSRKLAGSRCFDHWKPFENDMTPTCLIVW